MAWRESKGHSTDRYLYLVNTKQKKNRHKIAYASIPSAIQPSLHSDELLVLVPLPVFTELFPSEEMSIDEMQETDDVTQEILTDSDDPSFC